jgi:hypothetical protein
VSKHVVKLKAEIIKAYGGATKCSDHRTISLIAHTAQIIAKILKRRISFFASSWTRGLT